MGAKEGAKPLGIRLVAARTPKPPARKREHGCPGIVRIAEGRAVSQKFWGYSRIGGY